MNEPLDFLDDRLVVGLQQVEELLHRKVLYVRHSHHRRKDRTLRHRFLSFLKDEDLQGDNKDFSKFVIFFQQYQKY